MLSTNTFLQHARYRILRPLAAGGMGAVYEAHDQRLNIKVALKELLLPDLPIRRAFELEAQRLARLRHSALPNVMDHFVENDGQYLVMEYIEGKDLKEYLQEQGQPFDVGTVLAWADCLLDVLAYLHRQQPPVIHRDIKPANLKLTAEGEIVLLDFGIAKGGLTSLTSNESVPAYTLDYAPPEQITGKSTDARSDLYALAATLYHLLTGEAPENALTRLGSTHSDPLLPANQINPEVPAYLSNALTSALALDPMERPNSADQLRHLLFPRASEATTRVRATTPPIEPVDAKVVTQVTLAPQQPLRWLIVIGGALFLAAIIFGIANMWVISPTVSTATPAIVAENNPTQTSVVETSPTTTNNEPTAANNPTQTTLPDVSPATQEPSANLPTATNRPLGATLLHISFDDLQSITTPVVGIGGRSYELTEQDFAPAQVGQGALFSQEGQLAIFPIARGDIEHINFDRGEVEFWYRAKHDHFTHDGPQHTLFRVGMDGYNPPALQLTSNKELTFEVTNHDWTEYHTSTPYNRSLWEIDEWVQIRAVWDNTIADDSLQLYINGQRVDEGGASGGWDLKKADNPLRIFVGSQTPAGEYVADGAIDEFIIRELPGE